MSRACAPSCGLDRLGGGLAAALASSGRDASRRIVVTGGGCASFVSEWIEGAHHRVPLGRALPFALGLAATCPEHDVFVLIGDGEAAGVGGHHLLHAARRGDRVRALVVNNEVLGGTGGFPSPTTPQGGRTAALPAGSPSRELDLADLALSAGAAWVGRETLTAGDSLRALVEEFVTALPFALLEVRAPCYPAFGQWNGYSTPEAMHRALESRAIRGGSPIGAAGAAANAGDSARFPVGRLWPREGGAR